MFPNGIFRITAASPALSVANPAYNTAESIRIIEAAQADLVLLPELGLTGYTCGDLFASKALLQGALEGLVEIARHSKSHASIVVVGLPMPVGVSLMNVAAIIAGGQVRGIVPKTYLPNYREFYEVRHFSAASPNDPAVVAVDGDEIPFGTDLLFSCADAIIGVEICEDLWIPVQPSSHAALAGANVLLNLSASNETIGKATWRRDLVRSQSGRCIAAYAYASAGPTESTSDLVFGGHCVIAENGSILGESRRIGDGQTPGYFTETSITRDIDLQRLAHDRQVMGSFDDGRGAAHKQFRHIDVDPNNGKLRKPRKDLARLVDAHPFVPADQAELHARCEEIFAIQTAALVKRLSRLPDTATLAIGISGGLDSTLALMVALRACDSAKLPRERICALTMPGFGTSEHTLASARQLIKATAVTGESIDIRQLCLDTFRAIGHEPLGIKIKASTSVSELQEKLAGTADDTADLTFENVQARIRTLLLMSRGFVLGTGDMSEQALGWCTYNADHMSMYNVNTSIPKTLVRFLVEFAADNFFEGALGKLLHRIAATPISPELMPTAADGSIRQRTEAQIGAYELHDFFLFHFVRNGFDREKILYLARHAQFSSKHSAKSIASALDTFFAKFFASQFKRNCVPDGPKVGSVSLSPRGDWRMPSDADPDAFGA
ncbi:MAG: NAD(+) synthase [Pseudomonadales bacterium]